jgi:hypothetical protein
MASIYKSMFTTYILDEEIESEMTEQAEERVEEVRSEYPLGFFSSL